MNKTNPKKIVYVDLDDTICEYTKRKQEMLIKKPSNPYPQSEYGFFANLDPVEGAIDAVKTLNKTTLYDVWILTRPSFKNPFSYCEKRVWVEKHLGMEFVEKLILHPNKAMCIGDFLVDDVLWDKFQGEQIHFRHDDRFMRWKDVVNYLIFLQPIDMSTVI
jgi:5'-nucleotidase